MPALDLKRYYPKKKRVKFPCITVRATGFGFNQPCFPVFRNKPYVELFYDKKLKTIVIKPYHIETIYTIKTGGDIKKKILNVSCMEFVKENDILAHLKLYPFTETKSKRFKAVWDDKNKWFLLDLKSDQI